MKKRPFQLLLLFLLSTDFVRSQNLIVNPGFEDIGGNDPGSHELRYMSMNGWSDPTGGSSDISIERKKKKHKYSRFAVEPDSGLAQGGFYASRNGQYWAEYIQGTLTEPLTRKTEYTLSVSIKNSSDEDQDVINYIGISFSQSSRADLAGEHESIGMKADLILSSGTKVVQTNEWTRYTIKYTAKGGEQFFIIGTFDPSPHHHPGNSYDHSPYFCCDNFSLTRVRPLGPIPDYVFENDSTETSRFGILLNQFGSSTRSIENTNGSLWNYQPSDILIPTRRSLLERLRHLLRSHR